MHLIDNEFTLVEKMLTSGNRRIDCLEIIIERLNEKCFHLSCFMILPFKQNANSTFAFEFCTQNNKCKCICTVYIVSLTKKMLEFKNVLYCFVVHFVHSRFFLSATNLVRFVLSQKFCAFFLTVKFLICY